MASQMFHGEKAPGHDRILTDTLKEQRKEANELLRQVDLDTCSIEYTRNIPFKYQETRGHVDVQKRKFVRF